MSELRRWLDEEPPPQVRRLLELGQWERPSHAVLEQALQRARDVSSAGAGSSLLPMGRYDTLRIGVKRALLGTLLIGVIAMLSRQMGADDSSSRQPPSLNLGLANLAALVGPALREPARNEPTEPAATSPATAPATNRPAQQRDASSAGAARTMPSQRQAAGASRDSSPGKVCKPAVAQQIAILEKARSKIRSGSGAEALAILDRYDRFESGRCFVPESLKYRLDAYLQEGDRAGARRTASLIKSRYPDTAQARDAEAVLKR